MDLKKAFKRVCAFAMTIVMVGTSVEFSLPVKAAVDGTIMLLERRTNNGNPVVSEETSSTIIGGQGESIGIRFSTETGVKLDKDDPFTITMGSTGSGGSSGDGRDYFDWSGSDPNLTLLVKKEKFEDLFYNADGSIKLTSQTFAIRPRLTTTNVTEGSGFVQWTNPSPPDPANPPADWQPTTQSILNVVLNSELPLIEDAGFTLRFSQDQVGASIFPVYTAPKGYFEKRYPADGNTEVTVLEVSRDPRKWQILLTRDGESEMVFDVESTVPIANTDLIKQDGGSLRVSFDRLSTNSVNLTVMCPEAVLRKEADNLGSADPKPEDTNLNYYTLEDYRGIKSVETATGIENALEMGGTYIDVLTATQRYGSLLNIKWGREKMEPPPGETNTDPYDKFLDTLQPLGSGKTRMHIQESDIDVMGYLTATFSYKDKGSDDMYGGTPEYKVRIPIKILGGGAPATVKLTSKSVVEYDTSTEPPTVITNPALAIPEVDQEKRAWPMDVYGPDLVDPSIYVPTPPRLEPWQYRGFVNFGTSKGTATKLQITQSGAGQVRVDWGNGNQVSDSGTMTVTNTDTTGGSNVFTVTALKKGNITLEFAFLDNANKLKTNMQVNPIKINFVVDDHTPDDDPTLEKLDLTMYPIVNDPSLRDLLGVYDDIYKPSTGDTTHKAKYDYGFEPNKDRYERIELPYIVDNITFTPTYNYKDNPKYKNVEFQIDAGQQSVPNKQETAKIPLAPGVVVNITVTATAQNGDTQLYFLAVERQEKSSVAELKRISVAKKDTEDVLFADWPDIEIGNDGPFEAPNVAKEIPYSNEEVDIIVEPTNVWATKVDIHLKNEQRNTSFFARLGQNITRKVKKTIPLKCEYNDTTGTYDNITEVEIDVTSEDGNTTHTYHLRIRREPPSNDSTISAPEVFYWTPAHRAPQSVGLDTYTPGDTEIFTDLVPYSTNKVKLAITPNDYRAKKIKVTFGNDSTNFKEFECKTDSDDPTVALPLEFTFDTPDTEQETMTFKVEVTAEDGRINETYNIIITRKDPSRNTNVQVTLTDLLAGADKDFGYRNTRDDYDTVEFEYAPGDFRVLVKVTPDPATDTTMKITVNGEEPRPGGTEIPLTAGSTTTVTIVVTAEDPSVPPRTITIPLLLKNPSTANYLKSLDSGGLPYLPEPTHFNGLGSNRNYKIEIPRGTTTLAIVPTLVIGGDPKYDSTNATITVNGAPVESGGTFNFEPLEKTGKITVVVTAQDGKSTRTYTVSYKNWNLIDPSEENTLKSLDVDYGDLAPDFEPTVTEYEVYVKPDAMDVTLYPTLKDKNGMLQVRAGTKVIDLFAKGYSTSIMDDEMDLFIYVWSEKAVVEARAAQNNNNNNGNNANTTTPATPADNLARQYVIHLYRNDEEKQGEMAPITLDMVDFESSDPIVIDITKYPIVSADVFNTLKTDYPEKSILFKGNDYTLQIYGEDINGLVPFEDTFDLRFSFQTPDADTIREIMDRSGGNARITPVYYYFNQHGALPGEMLLTVSLGRHYRNQYLFWNYYNKDRDRIDYYGYVRTNAKGTFSVPLAHFSTYMTTDEKINGAENKSGMDGGGLPLPSEDNLNAPSSENKAIPNTGVGGQS